MFVFVLIPSPMLKDFETSVDSAGLDPALFPDTLAHLRSLEVQVSIVVLFSPFLGITIQIWKIISGNVLEWHVKNNRVV